MMKCSRRDLLRRRSTSVIARLLPSLQSLNLVRRRGVSASVRNCCFEVADHDWLLTEVKVLAHLLWPLCGPDQLSPEDRDGLDPWLLSKIDEKDDTVREPDTQTRKTILDALRLLCSEKPSRQFLRRNRAYPIVRDLDAVEDDAEVAEIAFSIVNFLARDEQEGDNEDIIGRDPNEEASTNVPSPSTHSRTAPMSLVTAKEDNKDIEDLSDSILNDIE